ncbi:hypothetical protein [Streptococcus suis]|uniref:Gp35 n=1 Tax=Streptococcus suis TaxID=1307 RepID=A0A9X4RT36_STRSU|nr:hypothetical protein [Streptococcus suis]MBY5024582.1 hypothetical protein [Streptococcus suis]MDG4525881.1 hypothetical protein [Streptococcus suis]MDG4528267.1 hypothetical protein [Streptococcus suis]QZT17231.1 hypothetical protein K6974_11775 [Streptococcus suis]
MERDMLPDLLKEVRDKFEVSYGKSEVVRNAFAELKKKKATYATANDFALEVGDILSEALSSSVTGDKVPDGKMYYNIAQRLLTDTLGYNFELVSGYTGQVQEDLNKSANIGLQVQVPEINQDRIDGIVNRLSSEDDFDKVAWMLQEPIVNFTQSIVDDSIKANAEFHYDSGLSPQIIRKEGGKCCDWCREVVGIYQYPKVPKDVYRRHQRCRCTVDYDPKNGKIQDVWRKLWKKIEQSSKIEERKEIDNSQNMSQTRQDALKKGIDINPIKQRLLPKTESRIIKDLAGGDLTKGSCSSLAFAYIGNKAGYNVLDFRGGDSCNLFSRDRAILDIAKLDGVISHISYHTSDFRAIRSLIKEMEIGKEYYLATGGHAAIIKKSDGLFSYLELQDPKNNGYKPLTDSVLRQRFGCKASHTFYGRKIEVPSMLIDIDTLGSNEEFHKILGFINTDKDYQQKGDGGSVR